ncbi:hypothetical protein OF83DRAFT_77005 [Amylostereum chailletii]|nr:hypothetical protein OF83DRAFT_77005 [Amylostereum chailletii]
MDIPVKYSQCQVSKPRVSRWCYDSHVRSITSTSSKAYALLEPLLAFVENVGGGGSISESESDEISMIESSIVRGRRRGCGGIFVASFGADWAGLGAYSDSVGLDMEGFATGNGRLLGEGVGETGLRSSQSFFRGEECSFDFRGDLGMRCLLPAPSLSHEFARGRAGEVFCAWKRPEGVRTAGGGSASLSSSSVDENSSSSCFPKDIGNGRGADGVDDGRADVEAGVVRGRRRFAKANSSLFRLSRTEVFEDWDVWEEDGVGRVSVEVDAVDRVEV